MGHADGDDSWEGEGRVGYYVIYFGLSCFTQSMTFMGFISSGHVFWKGVLLSEIRCSVCSLISHCASDHVHQESLRLPFKPSERFSALNP